MATKKSPAKKYFRTRGIKGKGNCGHEYTTRIGLGIYAGEPVTKQSDKKIQFLVKETLKNMSLQPCNTCVATDLLSQVEKSNKIILDSLGLPAFPKITGGVGQRAWAERVRNDHLRFLLFGGISPNLAPSILEFLLSSRADDSLKSKELKDHVNLSKNIRQEIQDMGYLGHVYSQELDSSSERVLLRRLLISRALVRNNMRFFQEPRHTFWIMYDKRGHSAFTTRFVPLSQSEFLAIAYTVNEDLNSVEEYEKAIGVLSKKAYNVDKEVLRSFPQDADILEKAELMNVYYSLIEPKEKDFPF